MPRLLLEGKSLTELLARVRAEHGADVTIVAADKVRTRGLGGFFARESYALTVEVSDLPEASVPGIHDLMDTHNPATRPDRGLMDAGAVLDARSRGVQAPGTLLELAAAIDAAEATENSVILATGPMHATSAMHATPQQPALSTASPEFAAILARLTALDAPQPGASRTLAEQSVDPAVELRSTPYARLRDLIAEIAPDVDLGAGTPIVLVVAPPAARASAAAAAPVRCEPPIPQQGRHRRAELSVTHLGT